MAEEDSGDVTQYLVEDGGDVRAPGHGAPGEDGLPVAAEALASVEGPADPLERERAAARPVATRRVRSGIQSGRAAPGLPPPGVLCQAPQQRSLHVGA